MPACVDCWQTDNPAGLTDWYWDLGTTTQNIAYFDWKTGEPDNAHAGRIPVENAILLMAAYNLNFAYFDAFEDVSYEPWFHAHRICFMCEVDLL